MKPNLPQISNFTICEQALDALREAILSGEMRPGQALIEMDLSRQLGVSRAPIRETLRILNAEGLVETVPYQGTTVRRLTREDVAEIYSMRILLETYALEQVMRLGDAADYSGLRATVEEMFSAGQSDDIARLNRLDRDFHDALIAMCGHGLLMTLWQAVAMKARQVMALVNRRSADLVAIALSHQLLLEAMTGGDTQRATDLLKLHIAAARDLVAEDWPDPR